MKERHPIKWAVVGLLGFLGLWLVAFGPKPSTHRLPGGRPVAGRVVVTFWEKWSGKEADALRKLIDRFNTSQSAIYVNLLSVSQINQKTLISTAGGDPPDIAGLWAAQVGPYIHYGAIRPLDELVQNGTITEATYKPYLWQICAPYGRLHAVSSTPEVMALFWNKQAFREAGLDPEKPPQTFEELDAMSTRLTRRDARGQIERMGFVPNVPGWWDYYWGVYFGNRIYDFQADTFRIDSPEQRAAYRWYQSYARRYGVQAIQSFSSGFGVFASPQEPFMSGKVAMVEQGPFFCNFITWYHPDIDYGVAPMPTAFGRPGDAVIGDADVWVIPRTARHPREALTVLAFLSRQENMEDLCIAHAKPSPLRQVSESFYQRFPSRYGRVFDELARSNNVWTMLPSPSWEKVQEQLFNAAQRIWLGEDVATVLADKQAFADAYVAEQHRIAELRESRHKVARE